MKKKFFIIVPIVIVILILMVVFTRNKYTGTWSNIIVYDNLKISRPFNAIVFYPP